MSKFSRGIVTVSALAALAFGLAPAVARAVNALPLSICASNQSFTTVINNSYFPLAPNQVSTFLGSEKGEPLGLKIEVLDSTEPFYTGAKTTRVVKETEWVDADGDGDYLGEGAEEPLIEESWNYFAQVTTGQRPGTVCYFGENVKIYEDGVFLGDTTGSWRADGANGLPGVSPGIFMPAAPLEKGQFFQTENAPTVAEDEATIIALDRFVKVPAGQTRSAIKVRDCNPLEGPSGCGTKYYAPGVGLIVDGAVELTSPNLSSFAQAKKR